MKNYILKLILLFPLIIYCSDNKSIVGNDFPFRKISDMVFSTTIYPTKTENIKINKIFGRSTILLLGGENDYTTATLIKFYLEEDLNKINEAKMIIYPHSAANDLSNEFETFIYEITSEWNIDEVDDIQINPTPINSFIVNSTKIEPDTVIIPPGLVQKWYNNSASNNGIMISSQNAGFIKKYFSRDNPDYPIMIINGETDTEEKTVIAYVNEDTYLTESKIQPNQDELIVDDLSIFRSAIKFDNIGIPENATINMALLELDFKPDDSFLQGDDNDILSGFRIETQSWLPDEIEFDTEYENNQQISKFTEDNKVQFNITGIVQQWVSKLNENYGLIIASNHEGFNSGKYIFNLKEVNQIKPVTLKIDYTILEFDQKF